MENKEEQEKDPIKELANNPVMKEEINNQLELFTKRQSVLSEIDNFQKNEFKNYDLVDENFKDFKNNLLEVKGNIKKMDIPELENLNSKMKNIYSIEDKLNQQAQSHIQNSVSNSYDINTQKNPLFAKDTQDLIENSDYYTSNNKSNIISTQLEESQYEDSMIGHHDKQYSINYMSDIHKDYQDMVNRNRKYQNLHKII